ncbi:MAG TPA: hypothetical protein PKI49_06260 [Pseudomonadota bacterium]|nr:hypothetical protein [Pseudomonadota bacterium]HNF96298.1 hypothetical protein [Pseudomonadota bacterium]HNK45082.1 hypothetical protein [Pseudomonadota bacterium]HNN49897.1 hypothetical protein [Pseudomonadota bacterium]HNO68095.1 hypothetical protein [Pseudomonadota bacterium]
MMRPRVRFRQLAVSLGSLLFFVSAAPVDAKNEPKPTRPICPLKCPDGFHAALYTWELHPERTVYDETGKENVPDDGIWKVSCAVRCELKEGEKVTVKEEKKDLCDSGGEPAPYVGPWRITGKWVRECAALFPDACGMSCYPKKLPPPPKKKPGAKRKKK